MDQNWTLAGSLSHRHKTNKWITYNICLLTRDSRLVGYKSTNLVSPSLTLVLCGWTSIFSGRDSGMDYVIKLTYPGRKTIVLAASSEEHALVWVKVSFQLKKNFVFFLLIKTTIIILICIHNYNIYLVLHKLTLGLYTMDKKDYIINFGKLIY